VTAAAADAQVLVVGAGPAGSSTAHHLARLGLDVLVLDRARFPRDKPCSEYMSPEASRILRGMGALDAIEAAGAAHLAGMVVRAPGGTSFRGEFAGAAAQGFRGASDRGLALRRRILDPILMHAARDAGARVVEGERVLDLLTDGRGRVVGVRTAEREGGPPRERRAAVVVGADGLRSVVARRLGLARRLPWPRRVALVGHYRGVAALGDVGEMHVERGVYLGIAHVGGGVANVALVVPAGAARGIGADRAAFVEAWIGRLPHLAPRFERAERVSAVHATGPFAAAARRAWSPGAALVGDAADFFDPFTGEGIYAALRGGELAAPLIADAARAGDAARADRALGEYEALRRREFGGKWMVERAIGAAVASPLLMDHAARTLSRRRDMADLLVGVTGDFVPAREVLRPGFVWRLLVGPLGSHVRELVAYHSPARVIPTEPRTHCRGDGGAPIPTEEP